MTNALCERLVSGPVLCAEGYLFELERRGYLQAGAYVPEVVLEHPEAVAALHREFVAAGSDVVEAFTYYAHREKLRLVGREDDLEHMNREALRIAREVAVQSGALFAGDVCNTNVFFPDSDPGPVRDMFAEQVGWAAEAGVDFVIGETFQYAAEAALALDVIKAAGLPAVITLAVHHDGLTREGLRPEQACRMLADRGADVVGLNCIRGPWTMLPLLAPIVDAVEVPVAALPVPYRTTLREPTFQSLTDPEASRAGGRAAVPGRAGCSHVHAVRDRAVREGGARSRCAVSGAVLWSRAAPCTGDGRGGGSTSTGEPLLG